MSAESNVLHLVIEGRLEEAREALKEFYHGELTQLEEACEAMEDLIMDERLRKQAATA